MFVSSIGSDLGDGLITRSKKSYRLCVCLTACDLETSRMRRPSPHFGCCATKKKVRFTPDVFCAAVTCLRDCILLDFLTLEDSTVRLSRNVVTELSLYAA
jgi:hypothetical protein